MSIKVIMGSKIRQLLRGNILKVVLTRGILKDLGQLAVEQIYNRTKTGYGVSSTKIKQPKNIRLEPLSDSYKDFRKGKSAWFTNRKTGNVFKTKNRAYVKKPKLGRFGTPLKSNLTLSGQMLESIRYRINVGEILIEMANQEAREKLRWAHEGSSNRPKREFFALTGKEQKVLAKRLQELVRRAIRRDL